MMASWWHLFTMANRVVAVMLIVLALIDLIAAARRNGRLLRALALRDVFMATAMGWYVAASIISASPEKWVAPIMLEHGWGVWLLFNGAALRFWMALRRAR